MAFTRAGPAMAIVFPAPSTPYAGMLPFLYCTRTILRPYRGYHASRKALYHAADDGGGATRPPKANGSRQAPEEAGFKVNEPWEEVWKTAPPKRRSRLPKNQPLALPQDSQEDGSAQEPSGADSYAPFGEWAGPATQRVDVKKPSRLHRDTSHVPFERMQNPVAHQDPHADFEGTTVTPSERKAFEALFKLHKPLSPLKAASQSKVTYTKVGRVESDPNSPLDPVIHKISNPTPALESLWSNRPAPEFPEPLRKLREATLLAAQSGDPGHSSAPRDVERGARESSRPSHSGPTIRKMSHAEQATIKLNEDTQRDIFQTKRLMAEAASDVELWKILRERVLRRVVLLQLDAPAASRRSARPRSADKPLEIESDATSSESVPSIEDPTPTASGTTPLKAPSASDQEIPPHGLALAESDSDSVEEKAPASYPQPGLRSAQQRSLELLSSSFPKHLINAFVTLTEHFPASLLPLTLLPRIRSLGPSSAALGLSTELYNLHLRQHWSKYRDLVAIDEILQEMNENVYEFDQITHNFVSSVLAWMRDARDGEHGPTAQLMSKMDRALRGEKAVVGWMNVITRRQYDEALRKAQEKEAMDRERLEEEENERAAMRTSLIRQLTESSPESKLRGRSDAEQLSTI